MSRELGAIMWSVLALEVALYHKQHELNHSRPNPRREEISR